MKGQILSIFFILSAAISISAQADAAFSGALAAAAKADKPSIARRAALKAYEVSLPSSMPNSEKAKLLAAKCTLVADQDFYAMYEYFMHDLAFPLLRLTNNVLPPAIASLVTTHSNITLADSEAKRQGKPVIPLEQRMPPGVSWQAVASGKPIAKGPAKFDSRDVVRGVEIPMNAGNFHEYLSGTWNVRLTLAGKSMYQETTWIFDIDGLTTVRVDARTNAPETVSYFVTKNAGSYRDWYKVHFDYVSGRVELVQDGNHLTGSLKTKSGMTAGTISAYKAPDGDYERLGNEAKAAKNYALAEWYYTKAIDFRVGAAYLIKRAGVRHDQNNLLGAIEDLSKAINLNGASSTAYFNRAVTYAELFKYDLALADANKAVAIGGKDKFAYHHLRGQIYRRMGRREEAIADFRETLKLNPSHQEAKTDLAKYGVTP